MATTTEALGIFTKCIILLIKEHESTKTVFELIRQRFLTFVVKLNELSAGEGTVAQTGSSFDELHLSRLLKDSLEKTVFYPPIDFDFMMSYLKYEIVDKTANNNIEEHNLTECLKTCKAFALMIPAIHPAYVKILITDFGKSMLESKKPQCEFEKYITPDGFIPNTIFKNSLLPEQCEDSEILYKRHEMTYTISGPAISNMENEPDGFSYDFVHSFPCSTWPDMAINWTRRPRPGKWPSKPLIEEIIKDGCAVVPVGQHLSIETDLEWRLSFNAAERKLSLSLLPDQRSCYSIVKLLLKSGMSSRSILTSYHVKMMMFWFCEQMYGPEDWIDDTKCLGGKISQLLDYIAKALEHGNIPSYFVPPNNLIAHRSKDEIDSTRKEVVLVKDQIYHTLALVCSKLQLFDQFGGISNSNELQQMLSIYTVFVQTIYKLAFLNLTFPLAVTCFRYVIALNRSVRSYIKSASPAFAASSVPELLIPMALAYTQSGDIDSAIRTYQIMLETERNVVESSYPEVFTNMACLYNVKYQSTVNVTEKQSYLKKSKNCFDLALHLIKDSPSLHFAYGNFLLETKSSVKKAIAHFECAVSIDQPRPDDEAFIQIDIPTKENSKPQTTHVTGKVASFYTLCNCLVDIDEIYRARKIVAKLEQIISRSKLAQKFSDYQLCSLAYYKCGLHVKGGLACKEGKKYSHIKEGK